MTLHERAEQAVKKKFYKSVYDEFELIDWQEDRLIAAIESALREVVEECAKVSTDQPIDDRWSPHWYNGAAMMQEHIAAAIRRLNEE